MNLIESQKVQPGSLIIVENVLDHPTKITVKTQAETEVEVELAIGAKVSVTAGKEIVDVIIGDSDREFTGLKPVA